MLEHVSIYTDTKSHVIINIANDGKIMVLVPYTVVSVIPVMIHVGKASKGLQHMYIFIIFLNNFNMGCPFFFRIFNIFNNDGPCRT